MVLFGGRSLGARVVAEDQGTSTRFEVWAPLARKVELHLHRSSPQHRVTALDPLGDGCWSTTVTGAHHGARYAFSLDGAAPLPDPASAWQPDGVHGDSAVVDTVGFGSEFGWTDLNWAGRLLEETVLYELHIGTFTAEGTFAAAAQQLDRLAELGITTIEVMPVNAFPGQRNWGYDGVFPFAVQHNYGGPEGLAQFVDAAHARGLAVVLDVVYNHLGPEGAVLGRYAPYFTEAYRTPWGDALNVMGPHSDGVRRFVAENLRRWVLDFHLDGFRLDAVHAVVDTSANPFWEQVADVAHRAAAQAGRKLIVIAESSDNDPRYLRSAERGGYGHDAVWNDDLHHCLRVALTNERTGYYADYEGTGAELADIIEHRWKFRGTYSVSRGRRHGRPADDLRPDRFVVYSQNHDQVGNRAAGERLDAHLSGARRRLAPSVVLLGPFTPMLFMGEEYGDPAPFPFFVDHTEPELLEAVRTGRQAEFPAAHWHADVPDPADPATANSAVLRADLASVEPHSSLLAMYTELLRLRSQLAPITSPAAIQRVRCQGNLVILERRLSRLSGSEIDQRVVLVINLGSEQITLPAVMGASSGNELRCIFDSSDQRWGGPGSGVLIDADQAVIAGHTVGLFHQI
jgi:maltooligosyltrehalose trehalohydrolase